MALREKYEWMNTIFHTLKKDSLFVRVKVTKIEGLLSYLIFCTPDSDHMNVPSTYQLKCTIPPS